MPRTAAQRQQRLLVELQQQSLFSAYLKPDLRAELEAEAHDPQLHDAARLVRVDMLERVRQLLADPQRRADLVTESPGVSAQSMGLFFSTDLVVVVPGFLGSSLSDVSRNGYGLIWINPVAAFRDRLGLLQLAPYADPETDLKAGLDIEPTGVVPVLYDLLRWDLEPHRYSVALYPVDWRKDLEAAARRLRDHLGGLLDGGSKPVHVVAHSQGALVARRALQLLRDARGEDKVRARVASLVLLGPANYGSFSAAFALAGNNDLISEIAPYVVIPPQGFQAVLQSMSGVYQLLPWNADRLPWLRQPDHDLGRADFWKPTVDRGRLDRFFAWGKGVDTSFLNDRTAVLLGDNYGAATVAGAAYDGAELKATHLSNGDGTVPDCCAYLEGVPTYRARNTEHLRLPTYARVLRAVRDRLAGRPIAVGDGLEAVSRDEALRSGAPAARPQPFAAIAHPPPPVAAGPEAARVPRRRPRPPVRRLRVFAFDPSLSRHLDTAGLNRLTLEVPWEDDLQPGPVGEYLEVVDADPASAAFYEPVNLNDPDLLAQDGLAPAEGDPQFHQQMVYAVAMTTIRTFEQALGRPALWAPHFAADRHGEAPDFVPRLRVYPHALREANAYYSPEKKALLFGYFTAPESLAGLIPPDGTVFACLSHEVVAHETTHALLDGLHRYFHEASNPDVLAFHEAFADLVALLQHFSHPGVLRDQVARTRGDLAQQQSFLGALAVEFGQARGLEGALRDAIGEFVTEGGERVWRPRRPQRDDYERATEPHERGAVLVAAVFEAYLAIYRRRVAPLLRAASNGSGILPAGELHPDLVRLLADEAARSAHHVLLMCLRALDYVPPVDVTFGEYLRALVTADADLAPRDDENRLAVVEAFARRGISPPGLRSLSLESLLWREPGYGYRLDGDQLRLARNLSALSGDPAGGREQQARRAREDARQVHETLRAASLPAGYDRFLGLALGPDAPASIPRGADGRPVFEVHSVRAAYRSGPDGRTQADLVIEITQRRLGYLDEKVQAERDQSADPGAKPDFVFRGGCTLLIDSRTAQVRYAIVKDVLADNRLQRQRRFLADVSGARALELTYLKDGDGRGEPFALVHRL